MKRRDPPSGAGPCRLHQALAGLLAVGIGLGAAELACRFSFRKNVEQLKFDSSDLYYYYDREGFRHNLPGRIGHEQSWDGGGKVEMRINALGFRGAEVALPKPKGRRRILFLGDSITLGGRLPEEQTFVGRVRAALSGRSIEVLNAGVGDVGLFEEERTLESAGLKAEPDLVVLCWYLNDARPPKGFPEEVVYGSPLIEWFHAHPWLYKSYLAGFLYDAIRRRLVARYAEQDRRFAWIAPYLQRQQVWDHDPAAFQSLIELARFDWGDGWNDASLAWMAGKIAVLRQACASKGVRFAVVLFPVHAQVISYADSPMVAKPQRALTSALAKAGIPFLDLLPGLRIKVRGAREKIFYDECHYTPFGNALVSDAILGFLHGSGLGL